MLRDGNPVMDFFSKTRGILLDSQLHQTRVGSQASQRRLDFSSCFFDPFLGHWAIKRPSRLKGPPWGRFEMVVRRTQKTTCWFIPLSKWLITQVINGISGGNVHLQLGWTNPRTIRGMNHQEETFRIGYFLRSGKHRLDIFCFLHSGNDGTFSGDRTFIH